MTLWRMDRALATLRGHWWALYYQRCLAGFPWYWPSRPHGREPMVKARRLVRQHFGAGHPPALRALAWVMAALAWPPAALLHLWLIRRHRGPGAVPVKRMPGAIWAALRHNILPGEYYAYEIWHPLQGASVDDFLYSNEASRLFKLLNRPAQPDPIGDKLAFHEMCKAHALPTPAVLAAFAPTGALLHCESGVLPRRDLFVKPRLGMSGPGAERLRWGGAGFVTNHGRRIAPSDVDRYLATRAGEERQTLLVQPAYANHPSLGLDTHETLATARLVTGRSTGGEIVPIFGFIYFGKPKSITSQHGSVALIDLADGRLTPAPPPERTGARHWHHWSDLGPQGLDRLPDWDAAVRRATAAHRACPHFVFVGWDIAFTDQGPMLLEGNANWSADEFQSLSGTPLGLTKFADILASRLETLLK